MCLGDCDERGVAKASVSERGGEQAAAGAQSTVCAPEKCLTAVF